MIYDNIIGSPKDIEKVTYARSEKLKGTLYCSTFIIENARIAQQTSTERSTLPWFDPTYMTEIVAHEIIKRWYSTRIFVLPARSAWLLEHFLTKNPFAARISPGELVNYISFESSAKGLHVPIDSAVFEENMKRLVSLGRTNVHVEVWTDLRYARRKSDRVERIVRVLEGIRLGFERLGGAGFRKVVFRVEKPDLELTHLVGKPEGVVRNVLVSLHVDVVLDAC